VGRHSKVGRVGRNRATVIEQRASIRHHDMSRHAAQRPNTAKWWTSASKP
jgi:hypothetical protein